MQQGGVAPKCGTRVSPNGLVFLYPIVLMVEEMGGCYPWDLDVKLVLPVLDGVCGVGVAGLSALEVGSRGSFAYAAMARVTHDQFGWIKVVGWGSSSSVLG